MDAELMRRRGIQVGHSLNMIAELPHYAYDPDVPTALRAAAFDAFFMHLRLLIDFLITKPRRDRPPEISRRDYVQDIHLDESLRQRLQAASQSASVHVAHYNADRVPEPQSPVSFAPARSELDAHRDDVFAAMAVIVERLKSDGSVHAAEFDKWLQDAAQRAAQVRGLECSDVVNLRLAKQIGVYVGGSTAESGSGLRQGPRRTPDRADLARPVMSRLAEAGRAAPAA